MCEKNPTWEVESPDPDAPIVTFTLESDSRIIGSCNDLTVLIKYEKDTSRCVFYRGIQLFEDISVHHDTDVHYNFVTDRVTDTVCAIFWSAVRADKYRESPSRGEALLDSGR